MNNNLPDVKKNYIYRLAYEILLLITPFITAPYVSRVLGADGVGVYSYTSSIMTYFTMFAALGTATYGSREISRHRDDRQASSRIFWEIELLTVASSLVCLIIWAFFIIFSANYRWYFIALIPTLLGTMVNISWFFSGHEKVKYIVLRNAACKLAGIVMLFAFVKQKDDLLLYVALNSAVTFVGSLSMWSYLPKMLEKVDFRQLRFKEHLRETLVYFIPTIATSIYTVLDKTLIGLITGDSFENGYYEQATKIIKIVKTAVFVSVNSVMGARISYLFAQEKYDEIRKRIERSMDFILMLGFGCVFGLLGIAHRFVPVFYGGGYGPVVQMIYLMSPLILIIGVSNCLGSQYFTPSGQRKRSAKVIIGGSAVNLIFNLLLIPKLGAHGAIIGSLIAEIVITVLYIRMCNGYMTAGILWRMSWKRIISGIIMLGIVVLTGQLPGLGDKLILLVQITAGVAVYFGILAIEKDGMFYEMVGIVKNKIIRVKKHG